MIAYNPKDWFTFIFRLHKSDTVRQLFPMMLAIAVYSWLVGYVELNYMQFSSRDLLKNLTILHSLLGFVISLLLVFRTNTAYERWWEGRKLWGALVNTSRNLAIKINALVPETDEGERKFFSRIIPLYAFVLRDHLQSEKTRLSLDENEHPELKNIDGNKHLPNQVARLMSARLYRMHREGKIGGHELETLSVELAAFTDICGACERIKTRPSPFPIPYSLKSLFSFT